MVGRSDFTAVEPTLATQAFAKLSSVSATAPGEKKEACKLTELGDQTPPPPKTTQLSTNPQTRPLHPPPLRPPFAVVLRTSRTQRS